MVGKQRKEDNRRTLKFRSQVTVDLDTPPVWRFMAEFDEFDLDIPLKHWDEEMIEMAVDELYLIFPRVGPAREDLQAGGLDGGGVAIPSHHRRAGPHGRAYLRPEAEAGLSLHAENFQIGWANSSELDLIRHHLPS